MNSFVNSFQTSTNLSANDSILQILNSGNQNSISQILISVSQQLNTGNQQTIDIISSSK